MKGVSSDPGAEFYHRAFSFDPEAPPDASASGRRRVYPDLNDFEVMAERYLKDNLGVAVEGGLFQVRGKMKF